MEKTKITYENMFRDKEENKNCELNDQLGDSDEEKANINQNLIDKQIE